MQFRNRLIAAQMSPATFFLGFVIFMLLTVAHTDAQYLPPGMSLTCQFTSGPRAGTVFDFSGLPGAMPALIGGPCTDGVASSGFAVAQGSQGQSGPAAQLQIIGNSPNGSICNGPLGPGLCTAVLQYVQQHPPGHTIPQGTPQLYQPQTFSNTGSQAQALGIKCAQQSEGNLDDFVSCAGQQVVLSENQQIMVDCAARSDGTASGFITCTGGSVVANRLNPDQQIVVQCIVETGGQPWAAAGCAATQLTVKELTKCVTNGIGGSSGCFGKNNDLVGRNGWTVRQIHNIIHDIQHGPGQNNDFVGQNGVVVRTAKNIIRRYT